MHRRAKGLLAALLAAHLILVAAVPALAADPLPGDPIISFVANGGRAFTPDGDGLGDRLELIVELSASATVSADVYDWEGLPIVALLPSPSTTFAPGPSPIYWDGAGAPNGPYLVRLVARTDSGAFTRELHVARVVALPYPVNPGAVAIFLDPGHGGDAPGGTEERLPDGTLIREEVLNLDISFKLAAMLRASGIRVSLSRTEDVPANAARIDRNGDRRVDGADDYLARIDGANRARSDLFVSVHNNSIPGRKGRTEAFYCGVGCVGSAANRALAGAILDAHVAALSPLQTPEWQLTVGNPEFAEAVRNPTDDYLRFRSATYPPGRHFYILGPFDRAYRPRALQMPATLVESLALSHPTELGLLTTPAIRTLLADAYFRGIAAWLANRPLGLRFDPSSSPATARVGRTTTIQVRVTNNGTAEVPAGSAIVVGTVARLSPYDGSTSPGSTIGRAYLREPLLPGTSATVNIDVRPVAAGAALWKVDAVVGGIRTSTRRVPFLQLPVTVRR